jgi:hypothetical protein
VFSAYRAVVSTWLHTVYIVLRVWSFEIHILDTKMTTEAVTECVKQYPVLYDMTRPDYKYQKGRIKYRMRLAKSYA